MITIENADRALKEYYLQAVSAQLNDNISPFFSAIEKTSNNVYGKDVKVTVIRGNSDGVAACREDDDLPAPYKNRYIEISAPLKNIYGTIEISDKALRASRDSSGAFVNLVNAEMEGLISDAKFNFQRMLYGDGNGTLCLISSAAGQASTNYKYVVTDIGKLAIGMTVDVVTTEGYITSELKVVGVSEDTKTVTFDGEVEGTAENACIMPVGRYGVELSGLGAIFGNRGLYSYDRGDEEFFTPYMSATDSLTENDLVEVLDYMEEHFNSKINMILCSYSTRRKIADLIADKKLVVNSLDANTGFGTVTVNGVPVHADRFCPEGVIYFVNTDDFALCQLCDWEWLEDEDGKILKQVPGKAAYSATLVKYAELICKKPCAQAVLNIG